MKVTKAKLVIFSVAVALISVFFFAYAVQAVYPAPKYDDFCEDYSYGKVVNESSCVEGGGRWESYENAEVPGHCDYGYYCSKDYEEARKPYERNVFFANIVIGFALLVGAFFLGVEAVSAGLMGGAVMLIFYGTVRYWGDLSDVWRTVALGIALGALIWLGYKKINE
jgi:hypothetical protein